MSRTIGGRDFGSKAAPMPKLEATDVPGKNPVLTVERVNDYPDREREGKRFLGIVFGEFPEQEYKTNATQEDALIALVDAGKLPKNLDMWTGKRIPFYRQTNTFQGVSAEKLYAVDPDKYDAALKDFDDNGAGDKAPASGRKNGTARKDASR